MAAFKNKTILQILDYYKNLWALSHVSAVSHWDLETYMPPGGVTARGEALARISSIRQKLFLEKQFTDLIHKAAEEKDLTDEEKGVVRVLLHALKFYERLPKDFLEEFEKLTNNATVVWREAKKKDDYKLFEPHLKKIFEMNKKMAEYLGYKDSPYDALLDQYDEGLTASAVSAHFNEIREPLKNLLTKILDSNKYKESLELEGQSYNKEKLIELNQKVLKTFLGDLNGLRLDVSAHPFTTSFSNTDTRITTWYHDSDFARSLLAVVHEFGHALYDMQCADELEITPIQGGGSLVIHESQSRLWENFVGRSKDFISEFLPEMSRVVGRKLTEDEVYMYFNQVKPSFVRVEADEVTYHFHILLRFEIEKAMIEGTMNFSDIRDAWNEKMGKYLGIVPKKDSEGILQDIHWSGGSVGYFPTYSLGTFLGAQWEEKIQKSGVADSDYKGIENWLKEHVHKYGSTYTLNDLLAKNDMKFDPTVNLNYLREKYSKIYDF